MATNPPDPDFSDSDQAWFDRLSARPAGAPANDAEREADALNRALALDRQAMHADPAVAEATSAQAREQRWQQLQFRLRREQAAKSRALWMRRAGIGGALAAGVLAAVLLVQRSGDDNTVFYDEPPTLRGEVTLTRVVDAKPKQAAEALAQALRAAGLRAALHQQGKTFTVDAVVAPDTPPAAVQVLRRAGASVRPGANRVEFVPR